MANEIFEIKIDEKVLSNLSAIDSKVASIQDNAAKANKSFADWKTSISEIKELFNQVGDKGLNDISSKAKDAKQGVDELNNGVNNLSETLAKLDNVTESGNGLAAFSKSLKALKADFENTNNVNAYIQGLEKLREQFPLIASSADLVGKSLGKISALSAESRGKLISGDYVTLGMDKQLPEAIKLVETLRNETDKTTEAGKRQYQKYTEILQRYNLELRNVSQSRRGVSLSVDDAMSASHEAKTINERIEAIKRLKIARDNLSSSDANYTQKVQSLNNEITRQKKANENLTTSIEQVKEKKSQLMDTSDQLARKLALLFSISQIQGYIQKLAQVRGEFELQNRSLQAILQNKDAADKLFGQITELAVESPFQLKELVSYTKQLAAYRIESEKLYGTTKMLADVSAGLGVDMQRLILAYGQVKAANYLRGTELRQFSEAGINILGELSKYFSELEGRAISTGDVFERVSKRMVTFGDVEVVFKRLTEAGGIFYNMQEIQAETLKGKISNLQDALDIMLNKIGTEHEGTMKGAIDSVKSLIANWSEIEWVLKRAIIALVAYKASTGIATVANSAFANSVMLNLQRLPLIGNAISALNTKMIAWSYSSKAAAIGVNILDKAIKGLAGIMAVALPTLLIVGFFELWRRAGEAERKAEALRKSLMALANEDYGGVEKSVDGYKDLVTRLEQANKLGIERRDIISKINSQYGEYLDFVVDENTSISQLTDSYDILVKRMKEKAAFSTYEKGFQKISESFTDDTNEAIKKLKEELSKGLSVGEGFSFKKVIPTEQELNDIFGILNNKIQTSNKELIDGATEQKNLLQSIVKDYYGGDINLDTDYLKSIDYVDLMIQKKDKELELEKLINATYKDTLKSREARLKFDELEKNNKNEIKRIEEEIANAIAKQDHDAEFEATKKLRDIKKQFELDKIQIQFEFNMLSGKQAEDQKDKIINWANATVKDLNETLQKELSSQGVADYLIDKILLTPEMQNNSIAELAKSSQGAYEQQLAIIDESNRMKSQGIDIDEIALSQAYQMKDLYEKRAGLLGVELKKKTLISDETYNDVNAKMKELYAEEELNKYLGNRVGLALDYVDKENSVEDILSNNVKQYKDIEVQIERINAQKLQGTFYNLAELYDLENRKKILGDLIRLLGGIDLITKKTTERKTTGRKTKDNTVKEQISLIKELNNEFEKQRKNWDFSDAMKRTTDAYAKSIKKLKLQDVLKDVTFDDKGIIKGLEKLKGAAKKAGVDIYIDLLKAIGGYTTQIDVDVKVSQLNSLKSELDGLFTDYELSLELDKLGLGKGLTTDLFDVDYTSLDEIKKKLQSLKPEYDQLGNDGVDAFNAANKKIADMEDKALIERLKTYSKYLKQSVSERMQIEIDAANKISEAKNIKGKDGQSPFSKEQLDTITANINKEKESLLSKNKWETFQNTEWYVKMFGDLDTASTKSLETMKTKLMSLQTELSDKSPEIVKPIIEQYDKLNKELIKRNPFDAIKKSAKKIQKLGKTKEDLETELAGYTEKQQQNENEIASLETQIDQKQQLLQYDSEGHLIDNENNKVLKEGLDTSNRLLAGKKKESITIKNNLKNTQKGLSIYQEQQDITKQMINTWSSIGSNASKVFSETKNALGAMGVASDSDAMKFLDMVDGLANCVIQAVMLTLQMELLGDAANAAMGPIGWIVIALQAVATILTAIFGNPDEDLEKAIEREKRLVDELDRKYKKLGETIEQAYSFDTLTAAQHLAEVNIKDRIKSYEKMIALERDKKDVDEAAIIEYQHDIEDLQDELLSMQETFLKSLGGIGKSGYKEAAAAFVDAWLTAFDETGNGLDGLTKKWDEYIENVIKKQVVLKATEKYLAPLFEKLDQMFESQSKDTYTSQLSELDELKKQRDELKKQRANMQSRYDKATQKYQKSGLEKIIQGLDKDINEKENYIKEKEDYLNYLAGIIKKEEEVTPDELEELKKTIEQTLPAASEYIQQIIDSLGGLTTGDSETESNLESLQKGISSITESTGGVIEAYLNSIRFEVFNHTSIFNEIKNVLVGEINITTPIVNELKTQTILMTNINRLLDSVTAAGHPNGGYGIRVFMD